MHNPLQWKPEHRAALAISTAAGAALGLCVGYGFSRYRRGILDYLKDDFSDAVIWLLVGGLIVGGAVYAYRMFSS